jgi:hypothetical protein
MDVVDLLSFNEEFGDCCSLLVLFSPVLFSMDPKFSEKKVLLLLLLFFIKMDEDKDEDEDDESSDDTDDVDVGEPSKKDND